MTDRERPPEPLPSGTDVLRGTHGGRVARIALAAERSSFENGTLSILVRFNLDIENSIANAMAFDPLRVVGWSRDGALRSLALGPQDVTVAGTAAQARATGVAAIRIDAPPSRSLWGGRGHYNIQIVDPASQTASNVVTVEGPPPGWPPLFLMVVLLFGAVLLAYLILNAVATLRREFVLVRRSAGEEAVQANVEPLPDRGPPSDPYADSTEVPDIPPALATAIAEGRGFLSLGTGAAGQAGLPTGTALLRGLIARFSKELPETLSAEAAADAGSLRRGHSFITGPLGKTMDVLLASVPRDRVVQQLSEALVPTTLSPDFHAAAVSMPWRGILSLTWDDLAHHAATANSFAEWQRLRPDDKVDFTSALRDDRPLYLEPLGRIEFPVSLSLSIEELRRNLSRNPDWQRGLALLLQSHSFLFVGTAPETLDQFFQAIALESGGTGGASRHFALAPMSADNDIWSHSLMRFGVELLPYGPGDGHRAVREFLTELKSDVAARRSGGATAAPSMRGACQVTRISLHNIGPFEALDLELAAEPAEAGQPRPWTVIFGSNGMGKSTILRALSLALVGADPRAASAGAKLLRSGAKEGLIELEVGSETLLTRLFRDGANVIVRPSQVTPVEAGFTLILGFPSLRGAPTPDPTGAASQEPRKPEAADLLPLLHGEVDLRLGDFKQWLVNILSLSGQNDPRAIAQRDLLDRIIGEIVPGDIDGLAPIGPDFRLTIRTADGEVPFDSMSQGMSSIFNWLGVLVQRLYQVYPDSPRPEDEEATVVVDEIDAHLHPDWQRRLVNLTKANFPRLQVIATSHSPLLAGALHAEEMCVFERDAQNRIARLTSVPDLFGQRSQVILTSAAFGLSTDRNPDVEKLIAEYFGIYGKVDPTPEERARMAELKVEVDAYNYAGASPSTEPLRIPDVSSGHEDAQRLQDRLASIKMGPPDDSEGEAAS